MEHDWMNQQVSREIDDLRHRYGFEEDEAVAYWHLQQAGKLMNRMRSAELLQEIARHEEQDDEVAFRQVIVPDHVARWHSRVGQHFAALNRALGRRVLSRAYPDGWGSRYQSEATEED